VVLYLSTSASARNQVSSTLLLLLLLAVRSVRSLLSFCATSIYYWHGAQPHSHLLSSQSISATLFCLRLLLLVVLAYPFLEYKLFYLNIFSPANFLCSLCTLLSVRVSKLLLDSLSTLMVLYRWFLPVLTNNCY
jgi:hypothetical protein